MATSQGNISLFVTFVDVEGPFFAVYGHLEKNAMENISPFIKSYTHHFENGIGVVTDPKQITVGTICTCKYVDSLYYRIKVLSVDHSNQQVESFFIDFGNRATIKFSDLRIISLPKQSNFLTVKPLCSKYIISNAVLIAGKEEAALNWIRPYVMGEETHAKVVDPRIQAIELCFRSNGKLYSVSNSLVHKCFATPTGIPDQYYMYQNIVEHKIPVQQFVQPPPPPPSTVTSLGGTMPPSAYGELPAPPLSVLPSTSASRLQPFLTPGTVAAPPRDPKPQSDALLQGHVYQVIVSYVDEEDMTVVVHKKEDYDNDLRSLVGAINSSAPTPYPSILEPGAYVLARQSPGAMLLRAVVFGLRGSQDEAQVYFVDFGHKALVSLAEVYSLPPEFATQKSMAHRCHLANLELAGPWSKEVRTELEEITKDKVLNMKILTSSLKTKRTVSLSFADDNRNVVDVLVQQLKPLMFESVHIPKGHSVEVVISHALSASRFFVQLTANQSALDALMDQVDAHCAEALEATPPGKQTPPPPFSEEELVSGNLPCCARFADDGRWYRAIITDYEAGSVTVRYVDFGNESVVRISDILPIPRALMKVRTQAVECSLAGHTNRRETDIEEATFQELIAAKEYTFLMSIKMHLVGSVLLVELWDPDTKNSVRHTLEAMVQAAQKAKTPTPVKSSPDTVSPNSSSSTNHETKNNFVRKSTRDKCHSSDESDGSGRPPRKPRGDRTGGREDGGRPRKPFGSERGASGNEEGTRPGGGKSFGEAADTGDWRKRRDDNSSGEQKKRFGDRGDNNRFGGGDKGDSNRFGGGDRGDGNRFGGADKGDTNRFGGGDRGDGNRFGGGDRGGSNRFGGGDSDSRPPRKPRFGDENERPSGGGSFGNTSGDDKKSYGGENRFRSGGGDRGWKSGGGGGERGGGGFKKREDFTSDNWGAAKSFDSNSRSFPATKPERPKLLDGYPAGGRVAILPALGALEAPRTVSVTHYESPLAFFVQLKDSHDSFLEFMKGLQSDYIKRRPIPSTELAAGQHVMAQFKEDRVLYRAEILQTSPDIKVRFFDYGNESSVPSNKVWHLSSEHCALAMQSIPCRLSNVESAVTEEAAAKNWSMDCLQYFAEDNYQMIIRGYDEQNKAEVDLSSVDSGLQVSTRLVEAGLCKLVSSEVSVSVEEPVDLPLLVHQTLAVHIAHVESSARFFIHVEPDKPDIIAAKIAELTNKPEELFPLTAEEIVPGKFVLATEDSSLWYRSRVTRPPQEDTVRVMFIDYGDSKDVKLENIRDIPEAACDWCPQATECSLASAAGEQTLDEALEAEFLKSMCDVNATVYVTGVDEAHRLSVVLYSESGELETKFYASLPPPAPPCVSPLCPYPVLRQGEKVVISHASADAIFLQKFSNETAQEAFAADLSGYYAATELPVLENPPAGTIVAALSVSLDSWYRARVETLVSDTEGKISVHYVDYGNSETLPASNVRALDASHFYPPAYSLATALPGTFVKDSHEIFADVDATFDAVYARMDDGWVVDLIGSEGSLVEKHVLSGQLEVQDSPFAEEMSLVDRWVAEGESLVTVMSFESPTELSISLQVDEKPQEELQVRLQAYADRTMPILGECQELCLGKYTEDGEWYRAQVLDAEFRALFVDYGNKDIVPEIRKLSYNLRRIPPLSVKCALPLVPLEADWSQAAIDRLDSLVTEVTPRARILDYDTVPSVELILENGKSVADVLVEEKLAARKSYKVVISHVNGPDEFYVQYVDNASLDGVFKVMEVIDTHAPVLASQVGVGDVVAAKYPEDEAWYRARILSKESIVQDGGTDETQEPNGFVINVVFIDFGNTSETSEFRRLPSSVSNLPPLAKPCTLALPEGVDAWPEFARDKLNQVSNEGADEFTLKWIDVAKNIVELVDAQNTNVTDIVLEPPPLKNYMLSHINSENDFYLQEIDDPHIGTITDLLGSLDGESPLESVSVGDLIAAKFIDDGAWYRARVVTTDPSPQVLFIDYGNTSPASEFRSLSESLQKFQPAAIHCRLAPSKGAKFAEYSEAASNKFVELSQGGETLVTCDFLEELEDGLRPVVLYIGEDSVADLLANVPDVPATIESGIPEADSKSKVIICWVNSADDFYVQQVNDPNLDIITDLLEPVAENAPIAVKPGDLVASQFVDDDLWYRSCVLKEATDDSEGTVKYEVQFVDYGNSAKAFAFRALPEGSTLEIVPACARRYSLVNATDVEEATRVLTELMDSARNLEVVEESGNVILVDEDGKRLEVKVGGQEATVVDEETPIGQEASQPDESSVVDSISETPAQTPREASPTKSIPNDTSPLPPGSPVKETSPISPPTSPTKASSPTRTPSSLKEKARASEAQKVYVITHVNSPSDFYLMVDAEAAIQIGKLLNNAGDFESVHSVIGGCTYAAFNEREDSWHRAQLLEVIGENDSDEGKDSYLVKYTDLGNTDIVTKDALRELPDDIRALPNAVKNCELDTPEEFILWSEPAVRKLTDLVVMGQFYVETLSEGSPARVVLRTTDGINVNEMLLRIHEETKETEPQEVEDLNETLNDTILSEAPSKNLILQRVVLSHVNTPDDFYVQVSKDRNILESINSLLQGLKPVDPADVILDEMYAGRESNGDLWFRVIALRPEGHTGYAVRRIDYGDEDTCTAFKSLSDDLKHISPLAHNCRVKDTALVESLAEWNRNKSELLIADLEETGSGQPMTVVLKPTDDDRETKETGENVVIMNGQSANGVTFSNGDADSPTKSEGSLVKKVGKASTPVVSPSKDSVLISPTKDNSTVSSPLNDSAIISPTKDSSAVLPSKDSDELKINTSLDDTFVSCVSEKTIIEDTIIEDPVEVYILNTNAIDDFYVHLESDTPTVEEMNEALQDVKEATHPLVSAAEVKLNEIYVCLFDEDSLYYRARVLAKVADRFQVLFVDYGNKSEVSELHECPPELGPDKIAPIAKHCEFSTPEGASVDLNSSGPLGKLFEAFDTSALDLKLKSLRPLGSDKFAIEIVIAETGENLLTYLAGLCEDVDK